MAVTISQTYNEVQGNQEPLICTVANGTSGQERFRYILQVNDGSSNIATIKQQMNGADVAHFDVHRIIDSLLSPTFENDYDSNGVHKIKQVTTNDGNVAYVQLRAGQEWALSGTVNAPTEYLNETNESLYVFNSVYQFDDGLLPSSNPFQLLTANKTGIEFLTNQPTSIEVTQNEFRTLAFLNSNFDSETQNLSLKITYFNDSGNIATHTLNLTGDLSAPSMVTAVNNTNKEEVYCFLPCGYQNLELLDTSSARPSNQASTPTGYKIQIVDSVNSINWQEMTFNIVCEPKYTPIQLAWVNRLGAWDYFSFNKKSTQQIEVERKNYQKPYGSWNSATFAYSDYDRGKTTYKSKGKRQITLNTDYVNDETAAWLEELFLSKEVLIYEGDTYKAVTLVSSNYQIKTGVNEQFKSYSITVEIANEVRG